MILLLLLQMNLPDMNHYVREASSLLGIRTPPVVLSEARALNDTDGSSTAWVTHCPGCPRTIYILKQDMPTVPAYFMRYFAYHEVCHLFLGNRGILTPATLPIIEKATEGCTMGVFDALYPGGFDAYSRRSPCAQQVPVHLISYHRERGQSCASR